MLRHQLPRCALNAISLPSKDRFLVRSRRARLLCPALGPMTNHATCAHARMADSMAFGDAPSAAEKLTSSSGLGWVAELPMQEPQQAYSKYAMHDSCLHAMYLPCALRPRDCADSNPLMLLQLTPHA